MKALTEPIKELGIYDDLKHALKNKGITGITGLTDSARTVFSYALPAHVRLFIASDEIRARQIEETAYLFGRDVYYYPARDMMFYQADLSGNLLVRQRMQALKALHQKVKPETGITVITTFDALMEKLPPASLVTDNIMEFAKGDVIDIDALTARLTDLGYEREPEAEEAGQFAVRGGIIDIYPLTEENPLRIELWGDEIDSIREYDAMSQRSIEKLERVTVYPATDLVTDSDMRLAAKVKLEEESGRIYSKLREAMETEAAYRLKAYTDQVCEALTVGININLSPYIGYLYGKTENLLDHFKGSDVSIMIDEPARCEERGHAVWQEWSDSVTHRIASGHMLPGEGEVLIPAEEVFSKLMGLNVLAASMISLHHEDYKYQAEFMVNSQAVSSYNKSFGQLTADLNRYKKRKSRVVILSPSHTRAKKLTEDFAEQEISAFYSEEEDRILSGGEIMLTYGNLPKGFEFPDIGFAVISESDIFGGKVRKKRRHKVLYEGEKISSFTDLTPGDYVVHEAHGIGIYRGLASIEIGGVTRDYVRIEYGGGSFVNVIASNLDSLQKYADKGTDKKVRLNKLGGGEWKKTKTRVRQAVDGVARQLVALYADRARSEGYVYGPDTVWQNEFEELFPYEETDDQLQAIEDVKRDMQSPVIMDRLICGDVGFGKTEIAIRAAFKTVQEGKQVAVLVPTTILAQQHMQTVTQRMSSYPVQIEMLSRFRSAAQMKKTIAGLKNGSVDIVIGTHRLLSKDVGFKDLGLLVVDEEQRFGVTHKERIKELRHNVDVLTLTATPIPRTLHMSLAGIRDMSLLREAPQDRLPIQTFVMEYSEEMVREALSREIARNGQVYYVHNRVNDIADVAAKVQELVPDSVVAFAHGQMNERQLEDIMVDFIGGDIDILVSTTIIETGLDIPNVNTIIVDDSERMGLAQLYQLRGRVGRSSRMAYAFLMYRRDRMLKETAEKRLSAIKEFTDLGSGYKIAMKDLEIRGAGNVLGAEQSGHMAEVGYDLYCKMLDSAVKREKGIEDHSDFSTYIDMDIDALIPDSYIRNENMKLDMYKRIARVSSDEEASDMRDELLDRFGKIPKGTENLIGIALLRTRAHALFIENIKVTDKEITMSVYTNATIDPTNIAPMLMEFEGRMRFITTGKPTFIYTLTEQDRESGKMEALGSVLEKMEVLIR
ncbi:MAG: transcription-repair coupling factor [Lachnospiraceae bacterium]|nr:transcription-repair coupling factor [Lachnospiraceae bacterium]MBQ9607660.1 transcription-repair coupling factor [Lachnospiraceae bacterium]